MGTAPKFRKIGGCTIELPEACCIVIFGASGDLARRKLFPSIFRLYKNRLLPESFFILGAGRTEMSTEQFREFILSAISTALPHDFDNTTWTELAARLYYLPVDYAMQKSFQLLTETIISLEDKYRTESNRIFFLAVPPVSVEGIVVSLGAAGLCGGSTAHTHIVIEKPFGTDIASARRLNNILKDFFEEKDIFRIDHFLAKETVQNIIMFRFANSIFEPLWNNRYIDHIQMTVAETLGIEGRAGYYEKSGIIRDIFQNHIFQLLSFIAMEPPPSFDTEMVRDETTKVLRSIRPIPLDRIEEYVVTGQYGNGYINGKPVIGYREEAGVSPASVTPTFAAMKVFVDNWRWKGVPFYLRSGKRLTKRMTEISVHFKPVPHLMFAEFIGEPITPNILILKIQPDEGISLTLQTKMPGSKVCLSPVSMDFSYAKEIQMDAYEWVLHDCIKGDQMLFVRSDGAELSWSLFTPVIERLEAVASAERFPNYAAGSAGPADALQMPGKDNRAWRPL